jgi:hypothetical protein
MQVTGYLNDGEILKQIGMRAGAVKNYPAVFRINTVYEEPVRFNMTFPFSTLISMQGMIFMFWKQWLTVNQQINYFGEFIHSLPHFFINLRSCLKGPVITEFSMV